MDVGCFSRWTKALLLILRAPHPLNTSKVSSILEEPLYLSTPRLPCSRSWYQVSIGCSAVSASPMLFWPYKRQLIHTPCVQSGQQNGPCTCKRQSAFVMSVTGQRGGAVIQLRTSPPQWWSPSGAKIEIPSKFDCHLSVSQSWHIHRKETDSPSISSHPRWLVGVHSWL